MQPHISFIGVGNMATAIIGGLIKAGYPTNRITGTARSQDKRENLASRYGIKMLADNKEAITLADIVVLCVKPMQMQNVIMDIKNEISNKQLYVSVAAGIELKDFAVWLGEDIPVVRSMPNTPSQVGAGMTGLIGNTLVSDQHQHWCQQIFASIGQSIWLKKEQDMHAVTALSGSSPAYFFRFLEVMIQAGQQYGLDKKTCRELATQAMLGAAKMAIDSNEEIEQLRKNITSPNGTTEQALLSLETNNIESTMTEAIAACIGRSKEMAQLFSTTAEQKG
ncbi:pyrroline-5-carboxylate reductase [Marinomonas agarivorans]|nr:pyrroline-5-carboxylate reductase [Marinomonas agarivorans]